MATTVRITVLTGPHKDKRFCFRRPCRCTVGRASDCFLQLAGAERDGLISRHHCHLDINPPCVFVWDLGSLNGTYLNGTRLEPTEGDLMAIVTSVMGKGAGYDVADGDVITVGGTSLQMNIMDCPPTNMDTDSKQPFWKEDEVAKRDCPISC